MKADFNIRTEKINHVMDLITNDPEYKDMTNGEVMCFIAILSGLNMHGQINHSVSNAIQSLIR